MAEHGGGQVPVRQILAPPGKNRVEDGRAALALPDRNHDLLARRDDAEGVATVQRQEGRYIEGLVAFLVGAGAQNVGMALAVSVVDLVDRRRQRAVCVVTEPDAQGVEHETPKPGIT